MEHTNSSIRVLLTTANVGTIFENLDVLVDSWLNEFTKKLSRLKPEFVALHMQEIGGKNYKTSMQSIDPFFKKFLSHEVIQKYNRYLIAVDSDFTDENSFTSLCNVYLIHESLKEDEVQLYNFEDKIFFNYTSRQFYTGNLNKNHLIYKERYMRNFFKDFQWSRKGFIQTKWRLKKQNFDLVNIHLFHDPSNLIAMNSTPSIYSENRKKALEYSIQKIKENHVNGTDSAVFSIFGDFNFRLDLASLVNDFTSRKKSIEFKDNNDKLLKVILKATDDKEVFIIEEKKFKWHHESSIQGVKSELLKYDIELSMLNEALYEAERKFPPSYPFMEELENPDKYMDSRCPAWCDRILMNKNLMKIIERDPECVEYGMIGENVCMGDHKPIFLFFKIYDQRYYTTEKLDNKYSNNIINNINTLSYPFNYFYLNNKLINLNDSLIDFHDNALFFNLSLIKNNLQFSKFVQYSIDNINSENKQNKVANNYISVNFWLKSILELIILFKSNESKCEECFTNKLNEHNCKNFSGKGLEKTFFVNFFISSLNGNFYKLSHLYSFINEKIDSLSKDIIDVKVSTEQNIELEVLFENSNNSLFLLKEIYNFLTSPCTHNFLKITLNKNNAFRKHLLFNQNNIVNNKINNRIDLKIDTRFLKYGSQFLTSLNNNTENCIDMNGTK